MRKILAAAAFGLSALASGAAFAETCGGDYTVARGDTLSAIADRFYKDAGKWTLIHNGNLSAIGPKPNLLRVGTPLKLACVDGLPTGLPGGTAVEEVTLTAAKVVVPAGNAAVRKKINLLTGSDYAPFTHKDGHNGGLLTEVVFTAMDEAAPDQGFAIHWVDDWASHFEPLLSNALLDLGFPWFKPDCAAMPDNYRCQNLMFSDPMFELLILLFADASKPFAYNSDADIVGKTLCRPAGYFTFDLDQNGRRWLIDNKITLKQPRGVKDCFDMVLRGEADAVAINEFTGRAALKDHAMADEFRIMPQPLSVAGLHVVVHKSHPQAEDMLAMINDGLRDIRTNGEYQDIIEDHMARIWADF
ncbi:MAG: transporter substrate-binding domain-containing protein [Pseudomonadota bacterium]